MPTTQLNIVHFRKSLLNWYDKNQRDLPFRKTKDPYKIWLSEIMLQQTTMTTVIDYYKRFTEKYPNLESVAKAREEDLLILWQGLGYYSRIRNFQIACQQVMNEFCAKIPRNFLDLKKLKGIGDYTAAAIASICFNKKNAVVDGNVKRVLSRVLRYVEDINTSRAKKNFDAKSAEFLDPKRPGDFNQAMMELGAIVCTPSRPKCLICPVKKFCKSAGRSPMDVPQKKQMQYIPVHYASLILHSSKTILLKKPGSDSLIAHMWELPSHYDQKTHPKQTWKQNFADFLNTDKITRSGNVNHAITNKKINVDIYSHSIQPSQLTKFKRNGFEFVSLNEIKAIPVNTLSKKILKFFFKRQNYEI